MTHCTVGKSVLSLTMSVGTATLMMLPSTLPKNRHSPTAIRIHHLRAAGGWVAAG